MGNVCGGGDRGLGDRTEAVDHHNDEHGAPKHSGKKIHMLILALDYPGTGHELTCTEDGQNMAELARMCGCDSIEMLVNNEANYDNVARMIQEVGGRCEEGDYFVFNYSGHGANVKDTDGDEADGQDEALCLVTEDGQLDWNKFMTDDDFAQLVTENVAQGVKILIMCDCCHSGTIGDFNDEEQWEGHTAVSMSGCKDSQTSGDTGQGGIWTHSLMLAIEQLQNDDNDDYSVGQLYNMQLHKDDDVFDSKQDIQVKWTSSLNGPEDMAWPFVPPDGTNYVAPWTRSH